MTSWNRDFRGLQGQIFQVAAVTKRNKSPFGGNRKETGRGTIQETEFFLIRDGEKKGDSPSEEPSGEEREKRGGNKSKAFFLPD